MSARHALLGLLLDRPAYPYQLGARLHGRLGPAWQVNSGQLYQTVKSLEKDGLIERVPDSAGENAERHVFRITDAGVGELERFFEQAPEQVRLCRRPLLLKITFAGPERLAEAQEKLDAYARDCARSLKEIARLREQLPSGEESLLQADRLLLRLNLSADVFQLEAELRWARHAREMLSWLASSDAQWPWQQQPEGAGGRPGAGAREQMFRRMAASDSASADDGRDRTRRGDAQR
ncbi:MAG: helix-turn-helix transcriptional regulator [Solirubrobacteraceae bacterium]